MSEKIKLKLGKVCDGRFVPALRVLLHARGLLATDAFRLRKTWDLLEKEVGEYRRTQERLLREHGAEEVSNLAPLREELNKLNRLNGLNELNGLNQEQKKCQAKLEADLAAMVASGKEVKQLVLDPKAAGFAEYERQLKALNELEVETDLRKGVTLPERVDLSAAELGELFEIIEEPE